MKLVEESERQRGWIDFTPVTVELQMSLKYHSGTCQLNQHWEQFPCMDSHHCPFHYLNALVSTGQNLPKFTILRARDITLLKFRCLSHVCCLQFVDPVVFRWCFVFKGLKIGELVRTTNPFWLQRAYCSNSHWPQLPRIRKVSTLRKYASHMGLPYSLFCWLEQDVRLTYRVRLYQGNILS